MYKEGYTVPVKEIAALRARKARVLHAHYTQCPPTLHANTQKCILSSCFVIHTVASVVIVQGIYKLFYLV